MSTTATAINQLLRRASASARAAIVFAASSEIGKP
jgi:hypothetical protein